MAYVDVERCECELKVYVLWTVECEIEVHTVWWRRVMTGVNAVEDAPLYYLPGGKGPPPRPAAREPGS